MLEFEAMAHTPFTAVDGQRLSAPALGARANGCWTFWTRPLSRRMRR